MERMLMWNKIEALTVATKVSVEISDDSDFIIYFDLCFLAI